MGFGCFVAFSQWLVPYFVNVYFMPLVTAGILAALFSFPSGIIRALGGWMSDKVGARKVMYWILGTSCLVSLLLIVPKMEIYSPGKGIMAKRDGVVSEVTSTSIIMEDMEYKIIPKIKSQKENGADLLVLPEKDVWHEPVVKVGQRVTKKELLARGVTKIFFQANVWIFACLVILLGSIWGIGKAAVYKHIPDYFPNEVGVVGGMVGVLGGLGGFVCPIIFGYLLEGTGLWTSCWMFMFVLSVICLVWMHRVVTKITKHPEGFESKYADYSRVLEGDILSPLFTWKPEYSVGSDEMDRQHMRLIELINELDEVIQKGRDMKELTAVLDGIVEYTVYHFAAEEHMMEKMDYRDIIHHKETHVQLINEIKIFQDDAESGDPEVMNRLLSFFKNWLIGHIMGIDKKYSSYFESKVDS